MSCRLRRRWAIPRTWRESRYPWLATRVSPLRSLERASHYLPDVTKDERYVQGIPGARSEVAIPLAVKNRVLGVLNLESEKANAFTEQDIQLLGALAYHASVAIQTSRLFQKISEKASELSAVIEIAKAVTSSVHMEVLKPTILEELKNAIPYDLAGLYLYDPQEGRLVLAVQEGLSVEEEVE